ncbi:MAG: hypothetical protein EHM35_02760 [Planctomycetaceae bacterium]|nr:MAG: hypothetical protein EHM35_02760 [Planctomycetaceae bacterium]
MTTASLSIGYSPSLPWKPLFLLVIVVLAALGLVYGTHAVEQHGVNALAVRACVENGGTLETWENPETFRQASICLLPDGRFGVMIHRFGREVTSFVKDKLRSLDQVRRYLSNRGYLPAQ